MDRRLGTKTPGEREDEEVERLMRPSPKVKPPRHDLRRETVEADKDFDVEERDKDLSKNFKDVGGSVASRIVARWAKGPPSLTAPPAKKIPKKPKLPAAPKPAGAGVKPPAAPKPAKAPATNAAELVKVRSKATGWVGEISKDKLKENPGAYELAKDTDEAKGKRPQPAPGTPGQSEVQPGSKNPEPKLQPKPDGQPKPEVEPDAKPEAADAASREKSDRAAQKQFRALAKDDPAFASLLEDFKKPNSSSAVFAKGNPGYPALHFMQGRPLPAGVKTVGDLARILNLPPAPKKQTSPEAEPTAVPPAPQPPLAPQAAPLPAAPQQPAPPAPQQPAPPAPQQPAPPAPQQPAPTAPQQQQQPAPPSGVGPAQPPASPPSYQAPPPEDPKDRALRDELQGLLKKSPELVQALSGKAKAQLERDATGHPDLPAADYFKSIGVKFPAGLSTLKDLQRVLALPAKSPQAPASKAKTPSEDRELSPTKYVSGQPERAVTSSERAESIRQVSRTFPPKVAAGILTAHPPYHPDEIQELIRDYNVAKAVPRDNLGDLMSKAQGFYATDPGKVSPPKDLDAGLSEVDRAKAIRKHQVQTVAMSLGAKAAVSDKFEHQGAPTDLANTIADFMLSGSQESPAERSKRAEQVAERIFTGGLKLDRKAKPLSNSEVNNLLRASEDPATRKLIVGYCQAQDYQEARKLFLDPESENSISELHTPKAIASKLSKAAKLLRERTERYPADALPKDPSAVFRNRVMKQLAALKPEKAEQVQALLDGEDNRYYEKQLAKHTKAEEKYKRVRAEVETRYDQDYRDYSEKLKKGGDPNEDPPPNVEDRLVEAAVVEPRPPVKPANYDKLTKKPEELGAAAQDLWKQFQSKFASDSGLIRRVAARGSIYSATCAMDRTAVYWGVDPYPKGKEGPESYQGWQQPQARDLGDSDFTLILKAARSWLKQPVLSANIEGIVRDTQLRAALDLALRAENYERAIHPAVYNKLLARLAGVSEDETLLTVRSKTARNPMSKKVELETARADRLLAGLDRIASVVQTNHKQWGMDFTAAKKLVNAIDKIADELETSTYGESSLLNRQAQEIGREKLAQVIEKNSDEKYMETFKNPMSPHQTEADEPYMKAYGDDQSSAVRNGKSTSGRKLSP